MNRPEFFHRLRQAGYEDLTDFTERNFLIYTKTSNYIHGRVIYPEAKRAFESIGINTEEFPLT